MSMLLSTLSRQKRFRGAGGVFNNNPILGSSTGTMMVDDCLDDKKKMNIQQLSSLLHHQCCYYSTTRIVSSEQQQQQQLQEKKEVAKEAARLFKENRSIYNAHLKELRREWRTKFEREARIKEAQRLQQMEELKRKKLERQRLKNIRSARSAKLQLEKQRRARAARQERIRQNQLIRRQQEQRLQKARQILVQELEQEAPHWITTPQEVEDAFSATTPWLWTYPGGVVGAPRPTQDAAFWQYETHTWHMERSYKTRAEILYEAIHERVLHESNLQSITPQEREHWTPDREAERHELAQKAKLRAMVRDAGRKSLLLKQRHWLQESQAEKRRPDSTDHKAAARSYALPVPKLDFLAQTDVLEEEGVKRLHQSPHLFFEFARPTGLDEANETDNDKNDVASLGAPIGLRDPIRSEKTNFKPYDEPVGILVPADNFDKKKKKKKKRGKKDSAKLSLTSEEGGDLIDEDQAEMEMRRAIEEGTLYEDDENEGGMQWDENTPESLRYISEELQWTIDKLEGDVQYLKEEIDYQIGIRQREKQAGTLTSDTAFAGKQAPVKPESLALELYDSDGDTTHSLSLKDDLEMDPNSVSSILNQLTEDQYLALFAISNQVNTESLEADEQSTSDGTTSGDAGLGVTNYGGMLVLSPEVLRERLQAPPNDTLFTAEEVDAIVELEQEFATKVQKATQQKKEEELNAKAEKQEEEVNAEAEKQEEEVNTQDEKQEEELNVEAEKEEEELKTKDEKQEKDKEDEKPSD